MSEVRQFWIPGPAGRLEASIRVSCPARAAAVVAHPHPLHGGSLHNPVVFHADRELFRRGFTTLRFNFRGVGSSEGAHDDGRGEVEDTAAAASWLRGVALGVPLFLAGYSFGSVCSLRVAARERFVDGLIAFGLPVREDPLDEIEQISVPLAVVQGSNDEFGSPVEVERLLRRARSRAMLIELPRSSHLFPGRAAEAASLAADAAEKMLRKMTEDPNAQERSSQQ